MDRKLIDHSKSLQFLVQTYYYCVAISYLISEFFDLGGCFY
nr:MAG TPA: hypothetical protein [Caudoviricetes sp.]